MPIKPIHGAANCCLCFRVPINYREQIVRYQIMFGLRTALIGLTTIAVSLGGIFNSAQALTLTDSSTQFSTTQGLGGWFYGYDDGSGFNPLNFSSGSWQTSGGGLDANGGYFNGIDSSTSLVRRWVSNFNGDVNISALFPQITTTSVGSTLKNQILINGESQLLQSTIGNTGLGKYDFSTNVQVGSTIDFVVGSDDQNWIGNFQFNSQVNIGDGLIYLQDDSITSPPIGNGFIVLGNDNTTSNRVGLFYNNKIYESSRAYAPGDYWDPLTQTYQTISAIDGVQAQHSLGSYLYQSQIPDSSPVSHSNFVALAPEIAQAMAANIETQLGAGYLDVRAELANDIVVLPDMQKGGEGLFSDAGIIEWAAENAGVNGSRGFTTTGVEFAAQPREEDPLHPYLFISNILSPGLQEFFADSDSHLYSDNPFQGLLNSANFLITDPLGRRLGFTSSGFINEMPGASINLSGTTIFSSPASTFALASFADSSSFSASSPISAMRLAAVDSLDSVVAESVPVSFATSSSSQCVPNTGNSTPSYQFFIPERLPGEYQIEVFDNTTTDPCSPDPNPGTTTIPESSSILSLLTFGILGSGWVFQRRGKKTVAPQN